MLSGLLLRIPLGSCAIAVEFVVYTEDRCCQDEELGDQRAVASGNFVLVVQVKRDERKSHRDHEGGHGHGVLYASWVSHGPNKFVA